MGKKLPSFKTEKSLVEWFENNSLSEYDLDEVKETSDEELLPLTIRLDKTDIEKLKKAAQKMGIGHTTLARMIIRKELESANKF
ncbi:MAG: BrnA antitoxin family protein [Thermotogae bacterium]|nr:BrnA antitoxin family protein [Thermotogota bacterium]